jgi:hypothetical protein
MLSKQYETQPGDLEGRRYVSGRSFLRPKPPDFIRRYGGLGGYLTMKEPVIESGWTSQRKK